VNARDLPHDGETQAGAGRLRRVATPEMVSYFSEDLAENASRGVVNKVTDVKLLQGDLSEAWREGNAEYASVAMRISLVDQTIALINVGASLLYGGPIYGAVLVLGEGMVDSGEGFDEPDLIGLEKVPPRSADGWVGYVNGLVQVLARAHGRDV